MNLRLEHIVIIALSFFLLGCIGGPSKYDSFAQCITQSGAQMYGAWWCPHCNSQKAMFGDAWKHIKYIECSDSNRNSLPVCDAAGVKNYPTWQFGDNSRETRLFTFEELAQKTGCTLPPN